MKSVLVLNVTGESDCVCVCVLCVCVFVCVLLFFLYIYDARGYKNIVSHTNHIVVYIHCIQVHSTT